MDLPVLDIYHWWSHKICGPPSQASFSVCTVNLCLFCTNTSSLFIIGYHSISFFWYIRHEPVKHCMCLPFWFSSKGSLDLFKLKKTLNVFSAAFDGGGVTAVFLLSKGCKSEFPGGLRQASSSAGRLVQSWREPESRPWFFFFPLTHWERQCWLLSQHYFRLNTESEKLSPCSDEAYILTVRKNRRD